MRRVSPASRRVRLSSGFRGVLLAGISLALLFGAETSGTGSAPTLISTNFFGGAGDQRGTGVSVSGGKVYVSGNVQPDGGSAMVLRYATPPAATPEWSKSFSSSSAFFGVAATNEGVYAAGQSFGLTNDFVGGKETKTVLSKFRLDGLNDVGPNGSIWVRGGPGNLGAFFAYSGTENFHGATSAVEGGTTYIYAVGGGEPCSRRAYAIAKYNTAGAFVAAATDPSGTCPVPSAGASDTPGVATLNGSVYIAGVTGWPHEGDTGGRAALWKYNSNLNLQWRRKSASIGGSFQAVAGIQNSLYAVGSTTPPGGTVDYLIEKYDETGNLLWSQTFGGSGTDRLTGVIGVGNRVFAVGWSTSPGLGGADGAVFEIDPSTGDELTSTLYGGAADDRFNGISTDGTDLYVVGESRSFATGGNAAGQNDVILVRYAPGAVFDTTAPTVTAHASPMPNASGWNNEWVMVTLVATDDTGGSGVNEITYSINGGATVPVRGSVAPLPPIVAEGQHTVTFRVSDVEGNQSAPGTLTVKIDRTRPTLNLPINVIAEATSLSGTPVSFTWSATDALSDVSSSFIDFQSGSLFQLGTTTVNVTATDLAGNTANGSFTVTVQDTTVPTIQTGIAPPPNAAGWNSTDVTVSFACVDSGSAISSCTPPLIVSTEGAGQHVTGTAIDVSGNNASKTATVNLDKTAPSLSLPPAIVMEATSQFGGMVSFTATAADSLSGVASTSISQGSGTLFPLGTTAVNFQATDLAGNVSNGSFNVVVGPHANDNTYSMAQHGTLTVPAPGVLGNDFIRAASAPSVEFTSPPGFGLTNSGGGGFAFASPSDFVGTVQVDYVVHTDDGDSNTGHISIVVSDATAPVLSLPSNITVYAPTGGGTVVNYTVSASDGLDGSRPVFCSPQPNTSFPVGTTTVNCSASDTHFNTATGNFTITVHLRVLTSISVAPASASVTPGGHAFFTATGHYNDGTSQQLSSGTAGGGPPRWSGHLTPGINLDMCTTAEYPPSTVFGGLSIFGFAENPATRSIVPTQWSLSTPIAEISGTIDDGVVHVDFACSLSGFSGTASFDGVYDGMRSKFVGTFTGFDGSTGVGTLTGWSTKASMPDARFAAGAATVRVGGEDVIYVAGGGDGSSFASALNAYRPDSDTWTNHGSMPTPREGVGVAALNGLVYVVGGHEPGGVAGTRVEAYDPVAGSWSTKGSLNTPRAEFSLVVADGSLFALGGQQGSNNPTPIASVERYDPALDTWTAMADMPDARSFFAAGALNILGRTTIVAAGGTIGSSVTGLYDVATNTWTAGARKPSTGGTSNGGVVNNTLWVITTNGQGVLTEGYFPETSGPNAHPDGWAFLDSMTTPRGQIAVAVANGDVLFTFGGNDGTPNRAFSTTEALTTPPVGDLAIDSAITNGLSWSSSDESVATIDQNGNSSALAPGTATIIASSGGISCASTTACGSLNVINNPPNVQIFFDGPNQISLGQSFRVTGSFFDDSASAPWTGTVDFGDGSGEQPLGLLIFGGDFGPTGNFSQAHLYTRGGAFTVTVRVKDSFNATGMATRTITVNAPPVVTLNTPFASLNEGSSLNATGSFTDDPGGNTGNWNVRVTYGDNTGQFNLPPMSSPGSFTLNHVYRDNGVYTMTVTVTDPNFLQSEPVSTQVTVNNVAPTINLQAMAGPINESTFQNLNVNNATITDPGANDYPGSNGGLNPQPGQWSATVDYGDNTGAQPLNTSGINNGGGNGPTTVNFNLNHAYRDNGVFTVTVTARDKDNATRAATMTVTVNNVAPSLSGLGGPAVVQEGATFGRSNLNFNDPGPDDAWTGTVTYGDGTPSQNLALTINTGGNGFPRGSFSIPSHLYVDNGNFTVTVVITDKDGGTTTTSNTFQVTVQNQQPDFFIDFNNLPNLRYNVPFVASGVFSDAGANDGPWTGTINFGDGPEQLSLTMQPGVIPPSSSPGTRGTFTTPSHTYNHSGEYTWTVTISDKDGAQRTQTFQVSVEAELESIVVTPNPAFLNAIGATTQFTGVVTFEDGSGFSTAGPPGEHTPFWFSTNPAVATVDQQGLATAVGQGVTTIGVGDPTGNPSCATIGVCATLMVDTTAPTLTLLGADPLTIESGSTFTDPGATAADTVAGDLTAAIRVTGTVNANVPGPYVLTYSVSDGHYTTTVTRTVDVVQTTPPTINTLTPSETSLSPVNHQYQSISIAAVATASNGANVSASCRIVLVTSNEPDNGQGDGDTANDIVITGPLTVDLRAEHAAGGDGRIYTATVQCTDGNGLSAAGTAVVTVDKKDKKDKKDGNDY
jgi:hypothetical protein